MGHRSDVAPITTRRLELVVLTASLVDAVVDGDLRAAERELGAAVGRSIASDPSHLVQLALADRAAGAAGFAGVARAVIRPAGPRPRMIGSIGFHGAPDDHGRLEVGCRIQPAHQGRGYGAEATTGLLEWATGRFGITRFLLAIPPPSGMADVVPIEIEPRKAAWSAEIQGLASLIEGVASIGHGSLGER